MLSDKAASWKLFKYMLHAKKKSTFKIKTKIKTTEACKSMHPSSKKCQILILFGKPLFAPLVQIIKSLLMHFRLFPTEFKLHRTGCALLMISLSIFCMIPPHSVGDLVFTIVCCLEITQSQEA